jgi:hypothetical protein
MKTYKIELLAEIAMQYWIGKQFGIDQEQAIQKALVFLDTCDLMLEERKQEKIQSPMKARALK